jgi:hypothetical protein
MILSRYYLTVTVSGFGRDLLTGYARLGSPNLLPLYISLP